MLYMAPVARPLLEGNSAAAHAKIVGATGLNANPDKHQNAIVRVLSPTNVAIRIESAPKEAQITTNFL